MSAAPTLGATACRRGARGAEPKGEALGGRPEGTRALSQDGFLVGPREPLSFEGL